MTTIKQGTPEWHGQRTNRITGTRCQRAFGEDQWASGSIEQQWDNLGRDMYREAHGLPQDPFPQGAMYAITYGKENEPRALEELKKMGYQIRQPSFVVHPEHDWLGMSPDGVLVKGKNGNVSAVEIKCPISKAVKDVKAQKRNYWHQMQLGMACMGIDEMLFFQWYENEHYQEWVSKDPEWEEIYIPKAKAFMDWYTEACKDPKNIARWSEDKEEPGVNYKQVDEDEESKELSETLTELKKLKERSTILEARKKDLSSVLVKRYGGAFSTPTVRCHMTQPKGRINYARLVKDQDIPVHILEGYRAEGEARIYTKLLEEN